MALLVPLLLLVLGTATPVACDNPRAASNTTIDTDVAIIGLGASGAYAAVRLREDYGLNVVVIEQQDRPGGHVATWFDPVTGQPFNYGVAIYTNQTVSRDFFARFDVPVGPPQFAIPLADTLYAEFATGAKVDYTPPSSEAIAEASERYRQEWLKYEPILYPSSVDFPSGDAIPEDLLLPWTEFAVKHNVTAFAPSIFEVMVVEMEQALFIDIFKAYGYPTTDGGLQPTAGTSQPFYDKIGALLGDDILYSSQVISSSRLEQGVALVVQGVDGGITQVNARQLLVAAPPENLGKEAYDLTEDEFALLNSPTGYRCYNGIVSHPSLPVGTVTNLEPGFAESGYSTFPDPTMLSAFSYLGNSSSGPVYRVIVLSQPETTLEEAQEVVQSALRNMINEGTLPPGNADEVEFKGFQNHGRLYKRWTADQLRNGTLGRLNALQGKRATWFTGAFWMNNDSAMLWNSTEVIVQRIVEGLQVKEV